MAARQHFSVENLAEVTVASGGAWTDLASFSPTLDAGARYLILTTNRYASSSGTGNVGLRLLVGGVEVTPIVLRVRSTRAAFYPPHSFMHVIDSGAGGALSVALQVRPESAATAYGDNSRIAIIKLSDADLYAESLALSTTTLTAPQTKIAITDAVEAGDYVAVGFGITTNSATTAPTYISLQGDGVATPEVGSIASNAATQGSFLYVERFTVSAGSRTFNLRYRAHSSTTAGIRDAKFVVLKASEFAALHYGTITSDFSTTSATAVNALSLTATVSDGPHLLLANYATSANLSAATITTEVIGQSGNLQTSVQRSYNADINRSATNSLVSVRDYAAGSRTWNLTLRSNDSTTTYVKNGAAIAVFDLGDAGGGGANDALTPTNIATGSPATGTPAIAQQHQLSANAIATNIPTTGTPTLASVYALTASAVSTGAPTLGSPSIAQSSALTASPIATGTPTVGNAAFTQSHALAANGISTGAPSLAAPAIAQGHALAANDVTSGVTQVGSPSLAQQHQLSANGVATSPATVGAPTLGQRHALSPNGIDGQLPTLGSPTLAEQTNTVNLTANWIASGAPTVGTPQIRQAHGLATNGLTGGTPSLGSPSLGRIVNMAAVSLSSGTPIAAQATLGQVHALTAPALATGTISLDTPSLGQLQALAANDIEAGAPTLGIPALTPRIDMTVPASRSVAAPVVPREASGSAAKREASGNLPPRYVAGSQPNRRASGASLARRG